jgi:hypothetical protein
MRWPILWKAAAEARKPNSVRLRTGLRRRYGVTIIPLAPSSLTGSSSLPGDDGRAVRSSACTRHTPDVGRMTPPYLALLRAGFCLPPVLPRARCALTAPFHPYPPSPSALRPPGYGAAGSLTSRSLPRRSSRREEPRAKAGGMFSVPLSFGLPRPGVTRRTALRSSDFPPFDSAFRAQSNGDRLDFYGGTTCSHVLGCSGSQVLVHRFSGARVRTVRGSGTREPENRRTGEPKNQNLRTRAPENLF